MKNEWQAEQLGEICPIASRKPQVFAGERRYFATGSVGPEGQLTESQLVTFATRPGRAGSMPEVGDVAFARMKGTKKVILVDDSVAGSLFSTGFCFLVPPPTIFPRFLFYFIVSDNFQNQKEEAAGEGIMGGITNADVSRIEFPYPPLSEQQRIVATLDGAFDGIATAKANAEKNLQNARALFESHLQSVFTQHGEGWVEKKVGEISKHSLGKMLDKAKNRGEPKPYLRNVNVRWFTFDLSDLLEMRFQPEETDKYTAIKGDVLICEGGYPGRAAIWDEDYPIYFQKAIHRVRFHEPEHNKWFVYFLYAQDKSGDLRQYFTGTGIQHFTGEALSRFTLPIAPLRELRRFVARFDNLSAETQRLESIYQQKLGKLEELKKSLLQQAFSGEL